MPPAMTGDSAAGMITFENRPCHLTAWPPAAARVEPMIPPISACDELDGIPRNHVVRFQMMPPASPANTTVSVTRPVLTSPLAIVAATLSERKAPTRLSTPGQRDGDFRRKRAGGDGCGHRVAGVVESVGEVESECGDDDQDQQRGVPHGLSSNQPFVPRLHPCSELQMMFTRDSPATSHAP